MIDALPIALAPDPVLPSRDALLDESVMRDALRAIARDGDARIDSCTQIRVNYQVGKSLRAVYRVGLDGRTHTVAARMFRAGRSADAYAAAAERAHPSPGLHGVVHLPALDSVVWVFPNDRKIDTLDRLTRTDAPPHAGASLGGRYELAAYAPEKSATLACLDRDGHPIAYAKVAAAYQAKRDHDTYQSLRVALGEGNPWLRLPRPIHYSETLRTLWLEAMSGRRLTDSIGADELEDLSRLGSAVAAFHGLAAPQAPAFERFSPARLSGDAELIARVRPDVAAAAADLARRLEAAAPPANEAPACLHGDLHPKNAIACGARLALIDVEDVAIGPAAADIGSLLAGLLYLRVAGQLSPAQFQDRARAFLRGYARVRSLPDARAIAWHTAAALFIERASRAVTRIRPLGLAWMSGLLTESGRLLDRGLELP